MNTCAELVFAHLSLGVPWGAGCRLSHGKTCPPPIGPLLVPSSYWPVSRMALKMKM